MLAHAGTVSLRLCNRDEICSANLALISGRRMSAHASMASILLIAMTKKGALTPVRTPLFLSMITAELCVCQYRI